MASNSFRNAKRRLKAGARGLLQGEKDLFTRFNSAYIFSNLIHRGLNIDPLKYPDRRKFLLTDIPLTNKHFLARCAEASGCKIIKHINEVPVKDIAGSIFYVYYECDSDALHPLQVIAKHGGTFFSPLAFENTEYRFTNRTALEVLKLTWQHKEKLSHLSIKIHENICEALELTKKLEGSYVEIGVYMGGSAFTALYYMGASGVPRPAWFLDTYDGFNYPQAESSPDGIWRGTHTLFGPEETMRRVASVLSETGQAFHLIESNICEQPLPREIQAIAVANIDVDMYEPTKAALAKVAPLMVPGGIIICEDATSTPGLYGAMLAMHEFLATEDGKKFTPLFKTGQYFLLKTA